MWQLDAISHVREAAARREAQIAARREAELAPRRARSPEHEHEGDYGSDHDAPDVQHDHREHHQPAADGHEEGGRLDLIIRGGSRLERLHQT